MNPYYLSHLAISFPNLLGTSTVDEKGDDNANDEATSSASGKEARAFKHILPTSTVLGRRPSMLGSYTSLASTLRALRLLQEDSFLRRDIIRPQVIESLLAGGDEGQGATTAPETEASVEHHKRILATVSNGSGVTEGHFIVPQLTGNDIPPRTIESSYVRLQMCI